MLKPSGRDHDSQKQLYLISGTPNDSKQWKKHPESFLNNIIFGNLKNLEIEHFQNFGNAGPDKSDGPPNKFLKNLNMGPISFKKHEMDIL